MDPRKDVDLSLPQSVIGHADLAGGLRILGLTAGDSVIVHTSLSSFGQVDGGARTVIEALLDILGPQGTLMMPHSMPYIDRVGTFDRENPPPASTGLVPRLLRTWPGAVLSLHPSHAAVALGPDAEWLTAEHATVSAVGKDSPYDRLAKNGGKILLLGVNQRVNTTIHAGEAYAGVPYWGQPRPDRPKGMWALMPDGEQAWLSLTEIPGDSYGFPKIEPFLVDRGLITFGRIGRARCRLMPGQRLIDAVVEFLTLDRGGLLCDRSDCTYCPWARQFL